MVMSLTDDQARVVTFADEYNMVCALPGSGKTHTSMSLCERILEIDPSYKVVMVTFTRSAATELLERVLKKCGKSAEGRVDVRTFHSLALEQWRNKQKAFKLVVGTEAINYSFRAAANSTYSGAREDIPMVLDKYGQQLYPAKPIKDPDNTWGLFEAYTKILKSNRALDLAMVCRNVRLGMINKEIPPIDTTHMIIDEFQDTDDVQFAWLIAHGDSGIKITVVGDDDQSIYGFRNSKGYTGLVNFQKHYNAIGHVLSICFRCKSEVLLAAKTVIEFNNERVPKNMESNAGTGGGVYIHQLENSDYELHKVVELIKLNASEEWAILARNNTQLDSVAAALGEHEIEFTRDDNKSFWDIPEVNLFLKLLYSLLNPYDSRYLNEVLGFIEEDEDLITQICKKAKKSHGFMVVEPIEKEWRPVTIEMHKRWNYIGSDTEDEGMIEKRIKTIVTWLITAKKGWGFDKHNQPKGRGHSAVRTVAGFITVNGEGSLHERLSGLVYKLRPKTKETEGEQEEKIKPLVTLKTLHSSKGLEWPNVMIVGVNNGTLPSNKATCVDEERRLLYVGMTRAQSILHLLTFGKPSEFLTESFPSQFANSDESEIYLEP